MESCTYCFNEVAEEQAQHHLICPLRWQKSLCMARYIMASASYLHYAANSNSSPNVR